MDRRLGPRGRRAETGSSSVQQLMLAGLLAGSVAVVAAEDGALLEGTRVAACRIGMAFDPSLTCGEVSGRPSSQRADLSLPSQRDLAGDESQGRSSLELLTEKAGSLGGEPCVWLQDPNGRTACMATDGAAPEVFAQEVAVHGLVRATPRAVTIAKAQRDAVPGDAAEATGWLASVTNALEDHGSVESARVSIPADEVSTRPLVRTPKPPPRPQLFPAPRGWIWPLQVLAGVLGLSDDPTERDTVHIDGVEVKVRYQRIGERDCLQLQQTGWLSGGYWFPRSFCVGEADALFVDPATGEVIASRDEYGLDIDRNALVGAARNFVYRSDDEAEDAAAGARPIPLELPEEWEETVDGVKTVYRRLPGGGVYEVSKEMVDGSGHVVPGRWVVRYVRVPRKQPRARQRIVLAANNNRPTLEESDLSTSSKDIEQYMLVEGENGQVMIRSGGLYIQMHGRYGPAGGFHFAGHGRDVGKLFGIVTRNMAASEAHRDKLTQYDSRVSSIVRRPLNIARVATLWGFDHDIGTQTEGGQARESSSVREFEAWVDSPAGQAALANLLIPANEMRDLHEDETKYIKLMGKAVILGTIFPMSTIRSALGEDGSLVKGGHPNIEDYAAEAPLEQLENALTDVQREFGDEAAGMALSLGVLLSTLDIASAQYMSAPDEYVLQKLKLALEKMRDEQNGPDELPAHLLSYLGDYAGFLAVVFPERRSDDWSAPAIRLQTRITLAEQLGIDEHVWFLTREEISELLDDEQRANDAANSLVEQLLEETIAGGATPSVETIWKTVREGLISRDPKNAEKKWEKLPEHLPPLVYRISGGWSQELKPESEVEHLNKDDPLRYNLAIETSAGTWRFSAFAEAFRGHDDGVLRLRAAKVYPSSVRDPLIEVPDIVDPSDGKPLVPLILRNVAMDALARFPELDEVDIQWGGAASDSKDPSQQRIVIDAHTADVLEQPAGGKGIAGLVQARIEPELTDVRRAPERFETRRWSSGGQLNVEIQFNPSGATNVHARIRSENGTHYVTLDDTDRSSRPVRPHQLAIRERAELLSRLFSEANVGPGDRIVFSRESALGANLDLSVHHRAQYVSNGLLQARTGIDVASPFNGEVERALATRGLRIASVRDEDAGFRFVVDAHEGLHDDGGVRPYWEGSTPSDVWDMIEVDDESKPGIVRAFVSVEQEVDGLGTGEFEYVEGRSPEVSVGLVPFRDRRTIGVGTLYRRSAQGAGVDLLARALERIGVAPGDQVTMQAVLNPDTRARNFVGMHPRGSRLGQVATGALHRLGYSAEDYRFEGDPWGTMNLTLTVGQQVVEQ